MSWILILLQVLGALPQIIHVVQEIITWIRQLKNPAQKQAFRLELRQSVLMHTNMQTSQFHDQAALHPVLENLRDRIKAAVAAEHAAAAAPP